MKKVILTIIALAVGTAYADTSSSDKDKATMEKNAYPSAKKQDEERTQAHSQPDVPNAGGTKPRKTAKNKASKPGKSDASVGSSAAARNKAAAKDGQNKPEQGPPPR